MKPFYRSKKFWVTVAGLVGDIVAHFTGKPELIAPITALAGVLVLAFGIADSGKEAAAIEAASYEDGDA